MNKEIIKPRIFCIGDIHGAYKGLIQVLKLAKFDYKNDWLITLGDIVDGWEDSFLCVEELLKIKNRIDIIGNHDDWFNDFCEIGVHPDGWSQGGLSTVISYAKGINLDLKIVEKRNQSLRSNRTTYMVNLNSGDIPEKHKDFFKKQIKYYKDDNDNVFVHGGFMRSIPLNENSKDVMIWDRRLWDNALSANASKTKLFMTDKIKNVFIGHTTTMHWGKTTPMNADIIWNLDTGAGGSGKLTLMNVDSHEYFQSDLITELYPDDVTNNRK